MKPEQFKVKMRSIRDWYKDDEEVRHIRMDNLMCDILRKLGYGDGVEIFEVTNKWYA